jgi:hypothetical protein
MTGTGLGAICWRTVRGDNSSTFKERAATEWAAPALNWKPATLSTATNAMTHDRTGITVLDAFVLGEHGCGRSHSALANGHSRRRHSRKTNPRTWPIVSPIASLGPVCYHTALAVHSGCCAWEGETPPIDCFERILGYESTAVKITYHHSTSHLMAPTSCPSFPNLTSASAWLLLATDLRNI